MTSPALDIKRQEMRRASVTAFFADGFEPQIQRRFDGFAKAFAERLATGGQLRLMRDMAAEAHPLRSTTFRVSDVGWLEPFS